MKNPLVLADQVRLRQFTKLGRVRRLFAGDSRIVVTDSSGMHWSLSRVDGDAFAVPAVGPGWTFDPTLAGLRSAAFDKLRAHARAEPDVALREAIESLRLGHRCERVLWSLHRHLVAARRSVFRVPDAALATDVYGSNSGDRPAHWRTDLFEILTGLTHLHVAEYTGPVHPQFGAETALLYAAADLRGAPGDRCGVDCPMDGGGPHHHFQINAGPGFLGILEQMAEPPDATGIRIYAFDRTAGGPTLRSLGRSGRLVRVYLPARLGEPAARDALSDRQHDLLQVLVREQTRGHRSRGARGPAQSEVVTGSRIRRVSGRGLVVCPALDTTRRYCGFNGNGVRRGRGYLLATPGGWLAKVGYPLDQLEQFVTDLTALSPVLGLVVVGMNPRADPVWVDPAQLTGLARTVPGRATLRQVHLRVFIEEGWEYRWSRTFGVIEREPARNETADLIKGLVAVPVSRRQLATDLGVDPSFLSKVLNGQKPWPADLASKARTYLTSGPQPPVAPTDPLANLWSGAGVPDPLLRPFGEIAAALVARGWSVVPVLPGEKKPCVKWKAHRERRPTAEELREWSQRWPGAGVAVALGPVSDLFVIDVDGPEAHAALVEHLGVVPTAPLAVSGSHEPYRYHLYFRHPDTATGAKATPWHPKLEFRGSGGLVVAPPSPHKSGRHYVWAPNRSPDEVPIPELPPLVRAALVRGPVVPQVGGRAPTVSVPMGPLPEGIGASTREYLSGKWSEGPGWNDRLFRAACDLQAHGVPEAEATPLLLSGARPWNEEEAARARATITSAYSQPRAPAVV